MGYLFAASIFDLVHFGIITEIAQWVLFWLGLQYMRAFSPLFDKARPWLLAGIILSCLSSIGFSTEQVTFDFTDIPFFGIAAGIVWLWFWYVLIRSIQSLEPVYGDLHSNILFKLYYITIGLFVASYLIILAGLLGLDIVVSLAILLVAAQVIVAILRIIYLYRVWQDFKTRREQLNRFSHNTFSEEKRQ